MYNLLIRIILYFRKPVPRSDPLEWLERSWKSPDGTMFRDFKIGACTGIYKATGQGYEILAVVSDYKGDFNLALSWFEKSAIRDNFYLSFLLVGNPKLEKKLRGLGYVGKSERMVKLFT